MIDYRKNLHDKVIKFIEETMELTTGGKSLPGVKI